MFFFPSGFSYTIKLHYLTNQINLGLDHSPFPLQKIWSLSLNVSVFNSIILGIRDSIYVAQKEEYNKEHKYYHKTTHTSCLLSIGLFSDHKSLVRWLSDHLSIIGRQFFHPSHGSWNIYMQSNNTLISAKNYIYFTLCDSKPSLYMNTHILLEKGSPVEGIEWDNIKSVMLFIGLGGLWRGHKVHPHQNTTTAMIQISYDSSQSNCWKWYCVYTGLLH